MVIGVATVVLDVPESASLKDKRRVAASVTTRLRTKYNVSVAEIDTQDLHGTLTLGIAHVSNDAARAHAVLERAVAAIERMRTDAVLADYQIEML